MAAAPPFPGPLSIDQITPGYNGGCLLFMPDGKIMLGTGWDGLTPVAQDPFSRKGKLLRLNTDGSAPTDNPYSDGSEGDPLVWASGLRQPWRCSIRAGTEQVFFGEVGWASWEEINVASGPGSNFGWRDIEGPGQGPTPTEEPLYAWPHLPGPNSHAAIGGQHVPSGNFPAEYVDDYFFADHNQGKIYRMQLDGFNTVESVEEFATNTQMPTAVKFGPDGSMYYPAWSTHEIRKIEFVGASAAGGRVQNLLIEVYEVHAGGITLDWEPSCNPGDTNYSIYAGTMGTWDAVNALVCSTSGALGRTVFPGPENTFYLIVPHNDSWQGSFGLDSEGSERPMTGSFCLPQVATPCM